MNSHQIAGRQDSRASFASKLTYGLLLCAALTPAFAQQHSTGDSDQQLVEIIVTAQRREQNLQDTPIAVSAFDAQALQESGVSNLKELTQLDPSLNITTVAGVYLPFLRGVGNGAASNIGNESSVAVYIDDVYYTRLSTAYLALGDIDRLEVLNGPQGTLFGRNSSGGAIQMFTKDPSQKPELDATIGYANYNTESGQLYASIPITDTLAWNVAVGGSDQHQGWGHSLTTGEPENRGSEATVRSKLIWEPTDRTRIKIVGFYAYSKSDIGMTPQDRLAGTYGQTPALPAPGYPNPPMVLPSLGNNAATFYDSRQGFPDYQREQGYGGSIRIDQEVDFADLVSISAFRNSKGQGLYDGDVTALNFENVDLHDIDDQITQEFQIKSKKGSNVDWILGAYYLHFKAAYDPGQIYGDVLNYGVAPGAVENIDGVQIINSYSAFGQATAPIGDKTNLTLGLRFTHDQESGRGQESASIPGVGIVPLGSVYTDSETHQAPTWKAAIDHHFTDDVMAYVSDSRGYKSGTFNLLPLNAPPAKAEIVDTYEGGVKSEFFGRRIRLNGALFWNQIKDPQVLTVINQGVASAIGLTNAQEARVKGGEIGVEAIATRGLNLRASATYLDGKYTKFIDAPCYSGGFTPGTHILGPVLCNASGNSATYAPDWRFNVGANYSADSPIGQWVGDVSASYTAKFAWTADNLIWQKAVTLVNASVNFTPTSMNWVTYSVWGKNLANVKYYSNAAEEVAPLGTGGYLSSPAPPLTFGGSISVKL